MGQYLTVWLYEVAHLKKKILVKLYNPLKITNSCRAGLCGMFCTKKLHSILIPWIKRGQTYCSPFSLRTAST